MLLRQVCYDNLHLTLVQLQQNKTEAELSKSPLGGAQVMLCIFTQHSYSGFMKAMVIVPGDFKQNAKNKVEQLNHW